jgi:hypothetical protein
MSRKTLILVGPMRFVRRRHTQFALTKILNFFHHSLFSRPTAFFKFRLAIALSLSLVSEQTSAGVSQKCLDAISLWMPLEAAPDSAVNKWSEAKLGYTVIAHDARISDLIEKSLKSQSQAAAMTLSPASGFGIDIFVAAVPDFLRFATAAGRDAVTNYFQDFHRRTNTEGAVQIDAASWEARFRNIEPKCLGSTLTHQHEILRAFIAIQQDESEACVDIGLGEILGLGNIRRYTLRMDRTFLLT